MSISDFAKGWAGLVVFLTLGMLGAVLLPIIAGLAIGAAIGYAVYKIIESICTF